MNELWIQNDQDGCPSTYFVAYLRCQITYTMQNYAFWVVRVQEKFFKMDRNGYGSDYVSERKSCDKKNV